MAIQVFRIGEAYWFAGETAEECIAFAKKENMIEDEEADDVELVSDEDMKELKFIHNPGFPDESECTFREQLDKMIAKGETFPAFFAASEF